MNELERITYEFHDALAERLCCAPIEMNEVDNNEEDEYIMGLAETQADIATARLRGE